MAGELHKGEGLREIASASQAQGSFSFDPDELQSLIKKWQALAESYDLSVAEADAMARVTPPGKDYASSSHAEAANRSGQSYIEYLAHNRQYCTDQADLFQNALNDYLGVEHTNTTGITKSGGED